MQEPTISDMSITDEHIVVDLKTRINTICGDLSENPSNAILVKKGSEILGIVTAKDIFASMADGVNATKLRVRKIMRTNVLSIKGDTPLSKGLDKISESNPDAIIVTDDSGDFLGYFSLKDYRESTRKLEAHQLMAARLKRSRSAISEKVEKEESKTDLLNLLLGGNEDEKEDTEVPSMISFN